MEPAGDLELQSLCLAFPGQHCELCWASLLGILLVTPAQKLVLIRGVGGTTCWCVSRPNPWGLVKSSFSKVDSNEMLGGPRVGNG